MREYRRGIPRLSDYPLGTLMADVVPPEARGITYQQWLDGELDAARAMTVRTAMKPAEAEQDRPKRSGRLFG